MRRRLFGTASSSFSHGPYWHQLNKGGWNDIRTNNRLKATPAALVAGGAEGVRAHTQDPGPPGSAPILKFYTKDPPRLGTAPWVAEWRMNEGDYLDIEIVSVDGSTEGHE